MNGFLILLSLHLSGAIVMFAGWGIELAMLLTNRSSERFPIHRFSRIAPAGMLLTLFTGIGLMALLGAVEGWMLIAIAGIILIISFGIYSERRAVAQKAGRPPTTHRARLGSVCMRIVIGLAILILMVLKPDPVSSVALLCISLMLGLALNIVPPGRSA